MGSQSTLALCTLVAYTSFQMTSGHYTNLLQNQGFETDIKRIWRDNGFTLARYQGDVKEGSYSIKCSGRTAHTHGPFQRDFEFIKGRHYEFQGWVKLLQDAPGKVWQTIKVIVEMDVSFQPTPLSYFIAFRSHCNASQGWILVKGGIEAPEVDYINTRLKIIGPDAGVDFLVDNVTMYEVPENPNWRQVADVNIENFRKANVSMIVNLPAGVSAADIDIEITHKNHEFAFGSLMREAEVAVQPPNELMQIAYWMFGWATVQSYKWKFDNGIPPNIPNFSKATDCTATLIANGLKVRGHSIFWDVEKNVPEWVKALTKEETLPTLQKHNVYMINLTRNTLVQFDVQNEFMAEQYYENKLNDGSVTKNLFKQAKALNPNLKLYINDFQAVVSGAKTEQYYDLVMDLLSAGPIVDGIGIQGHTKEFVKPDPTAMWKRLDRLAQTGLELMMTEFDVGWSDEVTRGDWLEDAIRAFFAHDKLRGVILWDFWNRTMSLSERFDKALVADDMTIMEPGQRFACLVKKEWSTNLKFNVGVKGLSFSFRGFQGDYDLVVKRGGVPVQRKPFYLGKQGATWALDVTSSTAAITLPPKVDFVPQCISHRDQRSLGSSISSAAETTLTCRVVSSSASGPNPNDAISVSCAADEVLTSCSSFHSNQLWTRNGEKIEKVNGIFQCTAYNGYNSPAGVKASAQCCRLSGLMCDYKVAGPSYPFDGAMAEALCNPGDMAIGCATYSAYPDSDGVRPSDSSTLAGCQAQSGNPYFASPTQKSGAIAYASCCSASSLSCQVFQSSPSSLTEGDSTWVSCPAGYAMTGCNVFAQDGKSGGSRVDNYTGAPKCRAYMGANMTAGSTGVVAIATCCIV